MGSGQSSLANAQDSATGKTSPSTSTATTAAGTKMASLSSSDSSPLTTTKPKRKPPKNESGYSRAHRICGKKKRTYDACYTAQLSSKEEDCDDLFEAYRTCFLRVMAKDMERRGVKVSENSMIGEYIDEIADEDDNR